MPPKSSHPSYAERLTVPWWWWPVLLLGLPATMEVIVVLGPQLSTRAGWPAAIVTFLLSAGLAAALLLWASARTVVVNDGELVVAGSRLPTSAMGAVTVCDRATTRALLTTDAHPYAYLCTRGWVPRAVRVEVVDPQDDTPYWLISSRHPERLAQALGRARALQILPDGTGQA
jgi:hypothetical protein